MSSGPRRSKRLRKVINKIRTRKKPRLTLDQGEEPSQKEDIEIAAPPGTNWDKWVAATDTRNYLLKDPFVDWLQTHYSPFVTKNPNYTRKVLSAVKSSRNRRNFHEFIMEQGNLFESQVVALICQDFGNETLRAIGGELNAHSPQKVQETLDAMNEGVPFIHGGLLHNPENQTYGIPDLLVRSDWINKLVAIKPLLRVETTLSAARLKDPATSKAPKYHYRVIDIKFTTLNLRSDGVHILNSKCFPAYKAQLWIYNEALARVQGYKPSEVYILGRRWKFSSKGETFSGNSCFDRLGVINYITIDSEYSLKTQAAISWVREVRSEGAENWNIIKTPLEREELYPNMSNNHDYPWRSVKKALAKQTGEITSLWMMGVKNRKRAHEEGVYEWTDPKCTVDVLGVTGEFTRGILKKMIKINRPRKRRRKIEPRVIKNNLKNWQRPEDIEFFVDFETVNDILTDFSDMPSVKTTSLIFMIGVGYINPLTQGWEYRNFTVNSLTLKEERRICQEFSDFIQTEGEIYGVSYPSCFHWAPAEERFWNDAYERHGGLDQEWEWVDLLQVFKEEPIVIEGCMGFSLKKVAKAMHKHGYIKTIWDSGSSCIDGREAMMGAWKAHKEAKIRGTSMRNMPEMKEVAKYNEVDIKVMQEIIEYLRKNKTRK